MGIPRESFPGERRVSITPSFVDRVKKLGLDILVAHDAGRGAGFTDEGIEVEFAIHPVAGRMPGHMNILLAEENIPYERLRELETINPTFEKTDMAIVIGANDVVIKRSLSTGFAGIPNPLFAADNTLMFFDDALKSVQELVAAFKEA
jgi:NAD(P) transhydrogenase subunit beta